MIGKVIVSLRKRKGWTQSDLAIATGLSKGYIAAIEEGKEPGIKAIAMIANALSVEAKELYSRNTEDDLQYGD